MQDRSGGVIFLLHWLPAGFEGDRAWGRRLIAAGEVSGP
jgi:hypothetical protein